MAPLTAAGEKPSFVDEKQTPVSGDGLPQYSDEEGFTALIIEGENSLRAIGGQPWEAD